MSPDTIAAIGAFLTGAGAVLGAMRSMRRIRRTDRDECDKRIAEIERISRQAYEAGLLVEPRRPEDDERWSHLP